MEWGKLFSLSKNLKGIRFYVRSGNSESVDSTWSDWKEIKNHSLLNLPPSSSIQFKVIFINSNTTLPDIYISYIPYHNSIYVEKIDFSILEGNNKNNKDKNDFFSHNSTLEINWKVKDTKSYFNSSLYFQRENEAVWYPLTVYSKNTSFNLDTSKLIDGKYYFKIVLYDFLFNPLSYKVSKPFFIDNSASVFKNINFSGSEKKNDLNLEFTVSDNSIIKIVYYSLNQEEWIPILPLDKIYDSFNEDFLITIKKSKLLPSGKNYLIVKAMDIYDNISRKIFKLN